MCPKKSSQRGHKVQNLTMYLILTEKENTIIIQFGYNFSKDSTCLQWTEAFHRNCEINKEPNDCIKDLNVVTAVHEYWDQVLLDHLQREGKQAK